MGLRKIKAVIIRHLCFQKLQTTTAVSVTSENASDIDPKVYEQTWDYLFII